MRSARATWEGSEVKFFKTMRAMTGIEASIEDVSFFQGSLGASLKGPRGPAERFKELV